MRKPLFALLFLLLLTLLACSLFPAATAAPPAEDAIATAVAATLAADTSATSFVPPTEVPPTPSVEAPASPKAVYVLEGNVWLWQPGNPTFQLTTSGDARHLRISPDGQIVAFVRALDETTVEIWAVDIDGRNLRRLVSADDLARIPRPDEAVGTDIGQMEWVPGTHTLAYSTVPLFIGPGLMPANNLQLVDADTAAQRTFLEPGQGGRFAFSPDGTRVVVSTATQIDLLWLDGRAPRQQLLAYSPVMTYSEYTFVARPQWAPDGSHLLVFIPPSEALVTPAPSSAVWYLPADGSAARQLASFTTTALWGVGDNTPLFNPALTHLVYFSEEGETQSLHVAAVDGSSDEVYASAPQITFFGWAPAALQFVYAADENAPLLAQVAGASAPLINESTREVRDVTWLTDDIFLFTLSDCTVDGCNWQLNFKTPSNSGRLAVTTRVYAMPEISVSR